jgi:hypothetical protein
MRVRKQFKHGFDLSRPLFRQESKVEKLDGGEAMDSADPRSELGSFHMDFRDDTRTNLDPCCAISASAGRQSSRVRGPCAELTEEVLGTHLGRNVLPSNIDVADRLSMSFPFRKHFSECAGIVACDIDLLLWIVVKIVKVSFVPP